MKRNGKDACDWCGRTFRINNYVKYADGRAYHHACLKKVGGPQDLGIHNPKTGKTTIFERIKL